MKGSRIFLIAGCVALVGFFWLVRWALEQPLDGKSKPRVRRSPEYEVASGMSVRYRHLRADSVSFQSCQIRRRRMGAFALGFRVLELEDVRLNLPLPAEMGAVTPPVMPLTKKPPAGPQVKKAPAGPLVKKPANGAKGPSASAPREDPLGRMLEKIGLSGIEGCTGVRIRGLRVGRMTDRGAAPLFCAMAAETRVRSLVLSQCAVFRDGKWEFFPTARIEWKDGLRLVWPGGSLDLPDLQEAGKPEDGK